MPRNSFNAAQPLTPYDPNGILSGLSYKNGDFNLEYSNFSGLGSYEPAELYFVNSSYNNLTSSSFQSPYLVGNNSESTGLLQFTSSLRASAGSGGGLSAILSQAAVGSTVTVHTGGVTFNVLFDAASSASTTAAANFRAGIIQAASQISSALSDNITVNIRINYSGTGGGAAAGPNYLINQTYSSISSILKYHASIGDTTFNALPTSISGLATVQVFLPEAKALGLFAANDTAYVDGVATFSTDIASNALVGVALHELTHAIGRVPDGTADIFDLFRFTAPNTVLISGGNIAPPAYFSTNDGQTALANFGQASDPSDFLNSGVQGVTDSFNEYYSPGLTSQTLSTVDLQLLDALGFHLASSTPPATYTVATFLSLYSTNQITSPIAILDSSVNVAANLNVLNAEAAKIASISLKDSSPLSVTASQVASDAATLALISGNYGLVVNDYATYISTNLSALQAVASHLTAVTLIDPASSIAITAAQSVNDYQALSAIKTANFGLAVTGTTGADALQDTAISASTMTGGSGADTFKVYGHATINDLGNGADILQIAHGGTAHATLAGAWTATSATSNLGTATLSTAGFAVDLSAATSGNGFSVTNTSPSGTTLTGSSGNDFLIGGSGNDILIGRGGNDVLTGNGGNDRFVFNTAPNGSTNFDTITDFTHGQDILEFSRTIFGKVTEHPASGTDMALSSASELLVDTTATRGHTSQQHFIYNSTSGILYYDATGTGSSIAVAMLSNHPTVFTYTDIHIIA